MFSLRDFLALSRAPHLPTIWSNCLAGWWLSGGGNLSKLPFLLVGTTAVYLGGAFLNDAFDAKFDREHRRVRPIASGRVGVGAVWAWGIAWLAVGLALLMLAGTTTGCLGLGLILCTLAYNATHRLITFSPLLMGVCRFFVYVVAASAAADGVTGWSIWCGLALGVFAAGVRFLASPEDTRGLMPYWPAILLAAPVLLAVLMDVNRFRGPSLLLCAVLGLWVAYSLRFSLWPIDRNPAKTIACLTAGLVFVDWLAVVDVPRGLSLVFLGLFGTVLLTQRVVADA